jgi:hypothetical protein
MGAANPNNNQAPTIFNTCTEPNQIGGNTVVNGHVRVKGTIFLPLNGAIYFGNTMITREKLRSAKQERQAYSSLDVFASA